MELFEITLGNETRINSTNNGKIIFKYPITIADEQTVNMFEGADIISLQMQNGTPTIWAIVDRTRPVSPVKIRIFGTGNPIPGNLLLKYIGTLQDWRCVWHVFIDLTGL